MTLFSRYYDEDGRLQETSMIELENLLKDEKNRSSIAELIYNRYYDRYLKIFDYEDSETKEYIRQNDDRLKQLVFKMEYKNGFSMMVNCCLLIETLASFLMGINKTPKNGGVTAYITVFEKAIEYKNDLMVFQKEPIYGCIRNGLLHQGETYENFKIRRDLSTIYDKDKRTIDATKFHSSLKSFLESYKNELSEPETRWDGDLWDKCRIKLRYIIKNSEQR